MFLKKPSLGNCLAVLLKKDLFEFGICHPTAGRRPVQKCERVFFSNQTTQKAGAVLEKISLDAY